MPLTLDEHASAARVEGDEPVRLQLGGDLAGAVGGGEPPGLARRPVELYVHGGSLARNHRRRQPRGGMLASLTTPTVWLAYFPGGIEFEVRLDGRRPVATWSCVGWAATLRARWGEA